MRVVCFLPLFSLHQILHSKMKAVRDQEPHLRGFTHGDVLEEISQQCKDDPVTPRDAAAIQAVEARAQGPGNQHYSIGATAQWAASKNVQSGAILWSDDGWVKAPGTTPITLGDVLKEAKNSLPSDKIVSGSDAAGVQKAEERASSPIERGKFGVGTVERNTADYNYAIMDEQMKRQNRQKELPTEKTDEAAESGIKHEEQEKHAPQSQELSTTSGASEEHECDLDSIRKDRTKAIVGV